MYAIVDIGGQQFKAEKSKKLFVHRLSGNEGDKVEFDKVLLIDNDGKVTLGSPVIEGAMITGKIISHLKGDKVLVFKKKRRKGYQKLNGHRQFLSEIVVEDIVEKGAKPKAKAVQKEEKPATGKVEKEVKKSETAEPGNEEKVATKKQPAAKTAKAEEATKKV
ncbi:MAG: 50S ribosomal protein L21, partial [Bacteroidota bacterium]